MILTKKNYCDWSYEELGENNNGLEYEKSKTNRKGCVRFELKAKMKEGMSLACLPVKYLYPLKRLVKIIWFLSFNIVNNLYIKISIHFCLSMKKFFYFLITKVYRYFNYDDCNYDNKIIIGISRDLFLRITFTNFIPFDFLDKDKSEVITPVSSVKGSSMCILTLIYIFFPK